MSKITLIGREDAMLTNDMASNISDSGYEIAKLHPDKFISGNFNPEDEFIVSYVTEVARRRELLDLLDTRNLKRATFIHPSAVVDKNSIIEPGAFIGPFSSVFYRAQIGKDVIIGPYSMISHLATVGQGTVTNPGIMIAGATHIGKYCQIGIKATFVDEISVCDYVKIGAGAVVTKSIDTAGYYLGSPARRSLQ